MLFWVVGETCALFSLPRRHGSNIIVVGWNSFSSADFGVAGDGMMM